MNTFLHPTIFKISVTVGLLLVAFGTPILYPFILNLSASEAPGQPGFFMIILITIRNIIYYPLNFVLGPFTHVSLSATGQIHNLPYVIMIMVIYIIATIVEIYLISCLIAILKRQILKLLP